MAIAASAASLAALVAVGCSDGGERAAAEGTALAWLPADTWLVVTGDVSAERIDEAVATLDRLPVWALAEGFLPAGDGAGLRRALLEQVATDGEGAATGPTAKELEAAFGDGAGFAITDPDFAAIDAEQDMPFLAWVEVDDEARAERAARGLFDGDDREEEHEGRTFWESSDHEATWTVQDGLLLVTTTPERMRTLIDVREGDDSLSGDEEGALVRAATTDAFASVAVQTDPLFDAAPQLAEQAAEGLPEDDPDAERAREAAERLGAALDTDSVRELVPDWVAGSITIDEVGLRTRVAWSNPRGLADADPGARELVERMPASSSAVTGVAGRGDGLRRVQEAWADAREEADLDLRDAIDCSGGQAWACELGVEALVTVLEDEELADAFAERGDLATVLVQDLGPAVRAAAAGQAAALRAPGTPAPAMPKVDARILEVVTPSTEPLGWQPNEELANAMERAGVAVTRAGGAHVVRIDPASPMGRALRRGLDAEARAGFDMLGIDVAALLTPGGMRIAPERVDGVDVFGLPMDAPSAVAQELEEGADSLGEAADYQAVVEAAGAPDEVGSWAWVDVAGTIESALAGVASGSPEVRRLVPTVRNNLRDVPGAISWTTVEEVDGQHVGVAESVLPILD